MILMPILYVRDVDASIAFYEALGFEVDATSRTHNWVELAAGNGAILALHTGEQGRVGTVELSMLAEEPLEDIREQLPMARDITDEAFGRSIVLADPDGVTIQVNEHDQELYT